MLKHLNDAELMAYRWQKGAFGSIESPDNFSFNGTIMLACVKADQDNLLRLKESFPLHFEAYQAYKLSWEAIEHKAELPDDDNLLVFSGHVGNR